MKINEIRITGNMRTLIHTALAVSLVMFFSFLARNYQMDDGLIYLRYLKNFHDGLGLVYNGGERFNGLTSPFFMVVVLLTSYLIPDLQAATVMVCGLFLAMTALLASTLVSRSYLECLAVTALLCSFNFFYMNFGMETSLFLFTITLSLVLYEKRSPWFIPVLALVALTRLEGALLGVILGLHFLVREKRLPDLRFLAGAVILFSVPFIFNYFYYGAFLPATGSAKIGQGRSGLWGQGLLFLDRQAVTLAFSGKFAAFVIMAWFSLVGILTTWRQTVVQLWLLFSAALFLVYLAFNVPAYNWYYAPFLLLLLVMTIRGVFALVSLIAIGIPSPLSWALVVTLLGLFVYSALPAVSFSTKGPLPHYRDIGLWLRDNTPPGSSIGLAEVGTVGWYSERHIVDLLGLVTADNADFIGQGDFHRWLTLYQPDYLLRHEPVASYEQSMKVLEDTRAYTVDDRFKIEGFVLLRKSESFTKQQISTLVQDYIDSRRILTAMQDSDKRVIDPDLYVLELEPGRLWAHAPVELIYELDQAAQQIEIRYGVDAPAQGLHQGLCFEVEQARTGSYLLQDCIPQAAPANDMERSVLTRIDGMAGDRLNFRIRCEASCDYGWSYWKSVIIK